MNVGTESRLPGGHVLESANCLAAKLAERPTVSVGHRPGWALAGLDSNPSGRPNVMLPGGYLQLLVVVCILSGRSHRPSSGRAAANLMVWPGPR